MRRIKLKDLLNHPGQLKVEVEKLRSDANQSEEIKGFIALYDVLDGDSLKIKNYLNVHPFETLRFSETD
jgi:hypothetical protein